MIDEATRLNDLELLKSLPRMNESVVKKYYPFIISHIDSFLNPEIHSYSFKHKLCYYFNNLKTFPKCKICGSDCKREIYLYPVGFNDANLYTCCKRCALLYGAQKSKQTNIQKYGVSNVSLLKEIQEKKNKTCMEHYGVTNPSKVKEICDKRSDTILERFNTRNVNELPEIKQKIKNTCLERYGVENAMYCPEIVDKIKQTNLKKFGSEWFLGTEECLEKTKKTVMEKYGVSNINQTEEAKQKSSERVKNRTTDEKLNNIISLYENVKEITHININCYKRVSNLLKYSKMTDNVELKERISIQLKRYQNKLIEEYGTCDITLDQIKEINKERGRNKNAETCKVKYGTSNVMNVPEIRDKIIESNHKKYNVDWYTQSEQHKKLLHYKNMKNRYYYFSNNDYVTPEFDFEYYINGHEDDCLKWKCKKCGSIFEDYRHDCFHGIGRCLECYPKSNNISKQEKDVLDFVKTIYNGQIIENTKSFIDKYELDLVCPDKKIAIEFDGVHWHTTEFIHDAEYHLKKTELCEEKGFQLIHIFENEWRDKNDIVKSRLKSIFGIHDNVVYARKCEIKEVDVKETRSFLENNHIQGNVISKINIGLFYNNELVSLMTFGGYRINLGREAKENEYELLRFCNKLNYHIPGAAGKLLNYFIKKYNPIKIISYADRRWSIGNLYEKLGFKFIKNTQVNYYYNIHDELENRFNWRKSVLINKLKIFNENLTEIENMKNNGYYQIFDCGSKLYEMVL